MKYLFACLSLAMPVALAAKAPQTDTLKIDVTASVIGRCGVDASGQRQNNDGRIDRATSFSFAFRLDCNTPFRIGVASENGQLQLTSSTVPGAEGAAAADGFATAKPYKVALSFMTDQDGLVDAGSCDSTALREAAGKCHFFGARTGDGFSPGRRTTAIGREGALTVAWDGDGADAVRLAAGDYQDVLTVVVGPRL